MSRGISIEEQLAPYVEKLHAEMRAVFGIPGVSLGSPEAKRMLKEVKKDVEVGPLSGEYVVVTSHPFLAGGSGGNTLVFKQDFPPGGKTLLSKPHPKDCTCPKCPGKIAFPGAGILDVPRIGDAERDQCLERLRHAFAGGCLNPAEHDARQDAVMSSTTKTELDFLVKDLPALPVKQDTAPVKQDGYRTLASALAILCAVTFPLLAAGTLLAGGPGAAAAVLCFATSLMVLAAVAVRRSA